MKYILKNFIDCSEKELDEILSWRNDYQVRKNSFNQGIIERQDHFNYVETLKNRVDRAYFLVQDENNIPYGVISFLNISKDFAEVGYYKAKNRENEKGIGKILLDIASSVAKNGSEIGVRGGVRLIVTEVFSFNNSSIKSIINAGYKENKDKNYKIEIDNQEITVYYYELILDG